MCASPRLRSVNTAGEVTHLSTAESTAQVVTPQVESVSFRKVTDFNAERRTSMIRAFPHTRRLRIASRLVASTWAWLLLLVILFVFRVGTKSLWLWLFAGLIVLGIASAVTAAGLKCPSCGRRVLHQTMGPKHPAADQRAQGLFDHWAVVVVKTLKKRPITCMYCGAQYSTLQD